MKTSNQESVMVQKFPIYKKLDPNNPCYNNLEPVYIGSRDGNHKFLQTNVEFHKPKINGNQVTGQDVVNKFPIEELNPITKELGQLEMQFDIFKDEWTLEELLHLNITEIPFLVEKLIPKDTLVVLAGQSEIGKSTLYTQLAIAIVRGDNEFLECKLNAIHKRVLVIRTEDGPIPLSFRQINK